MSPPPPNPPPIAVLLPPRERFSAACAGAVGLLVHRLAGACAHPVMVFGAPVPSPFGGVAFRPIQPGWWPAGSSGARYAAEAAKRIAASGAALIEVHNRPALARSLARRLPRARVVLVLHNDPQPMRGARSPAARRALLARLARVVAVSSWVRSRFLEGLEDTANPPVVIPNGIDLRALPSPVPAALRDPVLLFAGRLVADKGADLFVRACARALPWLPGWRAEMIGADRFGPDQADTPFLRGLRREAAEAGVVLHGYRQHGEVLDSLSRAAVVAVPSRWAEPFGLAALEALASGAALVCTARGGLPELVGEAARLIQPDAEALARALAALAGEPETRATLGQAGRARARLFDLPDVAARWNALRTEILA